MPLPATSVGCPGEPGNHHKRHSWGLGRFTFQLDLKVSSRLLIVLPTIPDANKTKMHDNDECVLVLPTRRPVPKQL